MTSPDEPTPGMDRPPTGNDDHLLSAAEAKPLKALGIAGVIFLMAAIALIGITLVALALGWALTGWIAGSIVCLVIALACLIGSRKALTAKPGHERAQHDPLLPEVTAEEAQEYEANHPHTRTPPRESA